jgi:hypothetical protein
VARVTGAGDNRQAPTPAARHGPARAAARNRFQPAEGLRGFPAGDTIRANPLIYNANASRAARIALSAAGEAP